MPTSISKPQANPFGTTQMATTANLRYTVKATNTEIGEHTFVDLGAATQRIAEIMELGTTSLTISCEG
jgi:hypothetical protein